MKARVAGEDWANAGITTGNLSALYLTLGELDSAIRCGERGLEYSLRSGDEHRVARRIVEETGYGRRRPEVEALTIRVAGMA